MKKALAYLGVLYAGLSFAHIKPFEHQHVGFLHLEDLLTVLGVISVGAIAFVLSPWGKKLISYMRRS